MCRLRDLLAPLRRPVLNGDRVHDVDDELELEGEAGEGGAQEVDVGEVVRSKTMYPPSHSHG